MSFLTRLIPLFLAIAKSRATESSSLAGIAVLTQIMKAYFPELSIMLDSIGGIAAGGAIFQRERGNANAKADPVNDLPRVE